MAESRLVIRLTNAERNALAHAASWNAVGNSGYRPPEAEVERWRDIAAHIYTRCAEPLAEPFRICLRPAGHDGEHGTDPDA